MKYSIKIITYADGSVAYIPQIYVRWMIFFSDYDHISNKKCLTKEDALNEIDKHYNEYKSHNIKSIEIEYITKN